MANTIIASATTIYIYIANHLRWKSFAVAKLNYNLLETISGWTVVLYGQSLLYRLFHWKSFTVYGIYDDDQNHPSKFCDGLSLSNTLIKHTDYSTNASN